MFRQKRKNNFLGEMFSIIIAVLFALGVEAWWSEKKEEDTKNEALSIIYSELKDSIVELEQSVKHHRAQIDYYIAYSKERDVMTSDDHRAVIGYFYSKSIFRPAQVSSTGWEIAKFTDSVGRIDMSTLRKLNDVFSLQDRYVMNWERGQTSLSLARVLTDDPKPQLDGIVEQMNQAWWLERAMVTKTKSAIEHLESIGVTSHDGDNIVADEVSS